MDPPPHLLDSHTVCEGIDTGQRHALTAHEADGHGISAGRLNADDLDARLERLQVREEQDTKFTSAIKGSIINL
jgi:hypothetical protein